MESLLLKDNNTIDAAHIGLFDNKFGSKPDFTHFSVPSDSIIGKEN